MKRILARLRQITTTTRIAFAMAMWSATVLLCLRVVGIIDDGHRVALKNRTRLSETIAVSCSQLTSGGNDDNVAVLLSSLPERNPEIMSAAIRGADGKLRVVSGNHESNWNSKQSQSNVNRIEVPVIQNNSIVSKLEIAFVPPITPGLMGFLQLPSVQITLLACTLNFAGFTFWLYRCFNQYDPSQVVPERVRKALDTLAEVVMVVDQKNRIMFANRRLTDALNEDSRDLLGRSVTELPWENRDVLVELQNAGSDDCGNELLMNVQDGQRVFQMNQSPIFDDSGKRHGTLLSLDDITDMRQKHDELQSALTNLEESQAEIAEQNKQLTFLATRDSMTKCFNRRAFFETFEKIWQSSKRYDHPLSCIMVDVDHFKSVNDNHGHAMGDEVLKKVSAVLLDTARDSDIVCRYGGEEFCVLLPHVDMEGAEKAAERYRRAIGELQFEKLSITASLGCSDRLQGAELAEQMLDQADQALYHAKRSGRNRVCRFDQVEVTLNSR